MGAFQNCVAIQESFQQSLVDIGSVVSEEKIFLKFHPPFFLISIIGQNQQKFKVHKKSSYFDKRSHLNLLL
jgi:UV DNA damage repair endonuclease